MRVNNIPPVRIPRHPDPRGAKPARSIEVAVQCTDNHRNSLYFIKNGDRAGDPSRRMRADHRSGRPPLSLLSVRLDAALRAADTGRAMSQENVEIVRPAFNRGDDEGFAANLHPDVESL